MCHTSSDAHASASTEVQPFTIQLLKWIGNKQRFAHEIVAYFPQNFNRYYEPFLGSGAVLATLSPNNGLGSDVLKPLIEIWKMLKNDPEKLKEWYSERWLLISKMGKKRLIIMLEMLITLVLIQPTFYF